MMALRYGPQKQAISTLGKLVQNVIYSLLSWKRFVRRDCGWDFIIPLLIGFILIIRDLTFETGQERMIGKARKPGSDSFLITESNFAN